MNTLTQSTPLECAFALADARGHHSDIADHPTLKAAHEAMMCHKLPFETVVDAALRIILADHRKQARANAATCAMNARLQVQLTAALEQVSEDHRARIRAI